MTYPLRTNLFDHPAFRDGKLLDVEIAAEASNRTRAIVDRLIPALPVVVHRSYDLRTLAQTAADAEAWHRNRDARFALHNAIYPRIKARATGRLTAMLERAQEAA